MVLMKNIFMCIIILQWEYLFMIYDSKFLSLQYFVEYFDIHSHFVWEQNHDNVSCEIIQNVKTLSKLQIKGIKPDNLGDLEAIKMNIFSAQCQVFELCAF